MPNEMLSFSLLLLSMLLLPLGQADLKQQQIWSSRARRQSNPSAIGERQENITSEKVPASIGGVQQPQTGAVNGQFQQDIMFSNNGCVYRNGFISENGGPQRKATDAEVAQVQTHLRLMQQQQEQFQRQMADQMRQVFAPPFPFGSKAGGWPMPQLPNMEMPEMPCFCQSCLRSPAAVDNNNSASNYNKYNLVGQQQLQGGAQGGQQQSQQQSQQQTAF